MDNEQNLFKNKRKSKTNLDEDDQPHYSFGFQDDEENADENGSSMKEFGGGLGQQSNENYCQNNLSKSSIDQEPSCIVLDSSSDLIKVPAVNYQTNSPISVPENSQQPEIILNQSGSEVQ